MIALLFLIQEHAAEAAQAGEHAESPNVFSLTPGVSGWTLIIFIILMVVLAKFAYPPILGYAAAREKRIQDALDDAKRQREETERLLAEQRAHLAQARLDAQQIIAEGRTAAERVRQDLLVRAKTDQEEMIARAKAELEAERQKAVESVRREAVDVALAAASRLIEQRLDADADRRLVNEYLTQVTTLPEGAAR